MIPCRNHSRCILYDCNVPIYIYIPVYCIDVYLNIFSGSLDVLFRTSDSGRFSGFNAFIVCVNTQPDPALPARTLQYYYVIVDL